MFDETDIYAQEISGNIDSLEDAKIFLNQSHNQTLLYAKDLAKSRRTEKNQQKALKIANFQIKHFVCELEHRNDSINKAYLGTLRCLALAADFKDQHTGEHIVRMSRYMAYLAQLAGFSTGDIKNILFVAPMHDIGKIGTPDAILNKP